MKIKNTLIAAGTLSMIIGSATSLHAAHGNNEERFVESQYRHSIMEIISNATAPAVLELRGLMEVPDGHVAEGAKILAKAASMAKASFEVDTRGKEGKTNALDKIWEDWDDFSAKMDQFEKDAHALVTATESGNADEVKTATFAVFKNCKSCHDVYRKPQ